MKCRRGDWCFFKGSPSQSFWLADLGSKAARDRIVQITERDADGMWIFAAPIVVKIPTPFGTYTGEITAADDVCLQPIRGDDDTSDETAERANETSTQIIESLTA